MSGGPLQEDLVGHLGSPPRLGLRRPELLLKLLLLESLVVGDDLPDAAGNVSLVLGDEAHEDLLE